MGRSGSPPEPVSTKERKLPPIRHPSHTEERAVIELYSSRQRYDWKAPDGSVTIPIFTVNMVFTCHMETTIHLPYVVRKLSFMGGQLNRKKFPAVVIRYRNPKVAILLFAQGKVVCTGSKSKEQARYMILGVLNELRKIGYRNARIKSGTFKRQNHVFSGTFPWMVDIAEMSLVNSAYCTYEPELFPGVIIRRSEDIGKKTVLTFGSGNFVITGGKQGSDALLVMDVIYPMVVPYARTKAVVPAANPFIKPVATNNELVRTEAKLKKQRVVAQQQVKQQTVKNEEDIIQKLPVTIRQIKQEVVTEDTPQTKKRNSDPVEQRECPPVSEPTPVVVNHMPDLRNLSSFFSTLQRK